MMVPVGSPQGRDALMELVSIGSGNALTSLNRMLGGGPISLSLPEWVEGEDDAGELEGLEKAGLAICLTVEGKIGCTFLTLLDDASAKRLAGRLLAAEGAAEQLGDLEESALLEAVNIISCSFLGALGSMVRRVLVPSPPAAAYGRLADLVRAHSRGADAVVVTTSFDDVSAGISGRILVLADHQAARTMLRAVGVAA